MNYLYCKILMLCFILTPVFLFSQKVTTLANVTANGGVTLDADGNLFVAHFGPLPFVAGQEGKNIYKITPSGEVSIFSEGQLNVGTGNHFDSEGNFYQANFRGNRIYKITPEGVIENQNFATLSGPVGITVIENDTLLVCECSRNIVTKITPDGTKITFASGSTFACANGITQAPDGNIYTTNFSDGRITKITPTGTATTLGNTPVGNGHLTYRALDQTLYIASYSSNRIFKMDMDGNSILFAGTGVAGTNNSTDPLMATFNKPNGIEISHDGCSLYITQDNDVIREIKLNDHGCLTNNQNLEFENTVKIHPTLTSGKIFIDAGEHTFASIEVLDSMGKRTMTLNPTDSIVHDISSLLHGIYFIKFKTKSGQSFTKKVVLK